LWFMKPYMILDFRGLDDFTSLQIVCFQRTLTVSSFLVKDPEKAFKASLYFPASAVLHVSCSFLSLSLSPNNFALFSPASACTRSHQDVTLESLKIVKLALTRVATTQRDAIK